MVFVEYENEVEEESGRVRALLEKLRIDAEVLVFYLASGHLNTYELIIHGETSDIDTEIIVNEALKNEEWWDDLQTFRRQAGHMSASQEFTQLAHILDVTGGRPGAYNPHEDGGGARRQSMAEVAEMPKKPDIAILSKLGVSMGIHTTHINDDVLQESESDTDYESDMNTSITDEEYGLGVQGLDDPFVATPQPDTVDPLRRPLLSGARGGSESSPKAGSSGKFPRGRRPPPPNNPSSTTAPAYGTMTSSQTLADRQEPPAGRRIPEVTEIGASPPKDAGGPARIESFPVLDPLQVPEFPSGSSHRSRSMSPSRGGKLTPSGGMTPARPSFSRQSSAARFSSRPVPETQITTEAEGSKISFAPSASTPATPRMERPAFSRQSSLGKFSSRPMPETKVSVGGDDGARTISFAAQPTTYQSHSRHHSRQGSQYSITGGQGGDTTRSIPEYSELPKTGVGETSTGNMDSESAFSGQDDLSLSFNDLPSRAQHLILNELMQQHSKDTAVLMTTLPIPSEGTSLDEMSTIQYLSDVEVLCNELPPTLMVLSNNMTVTVSL